MKIIFGFSKSYNEILEEQAIEKVSERRRSLFDSCTIKMAENVNVCKEWFPTKLFEHADLRRERIYEEKYARTLRLYNSPLYTMRRRLKENIPARYE